eukprot:CAMPEP_0201278296 /NCGR_PEP_ID=MMETSP0853-20130426/60058_1 /ASSEMBLY_ACC=CAM_ASM_000640 /TAXON_ID=183588 /ORGANISM="Pseudo-nitzschia fraudulenta, Strain WWA7" /LENGTH=135 /DNA_ID=CAMNT_0047586599 /DNA_START=288 /DNA_END=692 /DNA_ORIENTATION=+
MCDLIALRGGLTRLINANDRSESFHCCCCRNQRLLIELLSSIADTDAPGVAADRSTAFVAGGPRSKQRSINGLTIRNVVACAADADHRRQSISSVSLLLFAAAAAAISLSSVADVNAAAAAATTAAADRSTVVVA